MRQQTVFQKNGFGLQTTTHSHSHSSHRFVPHLLFSRFPNAFSTSTSRSSCLGTGAGDGATLEDTPPLFFFAKLTSGFFFAKLVSGDLRIGVAVFAPPCPKLFPLFSGFRKEFAFLNAMSSYRALALARIAPAFAKIKAIKPNPTVIHKIPKPLGLPSGRGDVAETHGGL